MIDTGNILWTEYETEEKEVGIVFRHWLGVTDFEMPYCYVSVAEINPENFRADISTQGWRLTAHGFPTSDMAMNWADRQVSMIWEMM